MEAHGEKKETVDEVVLVADDGRRMSVRVLPLRGRTHLCILDVDNPPWFFTRESLPPTDDAWIRAVADLGADDPDYHWDTPRYRELCLQGGLDPDKGRPRFHPDDSGAGDELVRLANRTTDGLRPAAADIVMDLVDLLRLGGTEPGGAAPVIRQKFARLMQSDPTSAGELLGTIARVMETARPASLVAAASALGVAQ